MCKKFLRTSALSALLIMGLIATNETANAAISGDSSCSSCKDAFFTGVDACLAGICKENGFRSQQCVDCIAVPTTTLETCAEEHCESTATTKNKK